ncbi:MAG TPA: hypothetical protein VEJ63_01370 [Planctomycetota bacterium]|nr:hypothetical protein [Planctomycetota bacterium]
MSESISDEDALRLLKDAEAEHLETVDPPATRRERLLRAIPLFVLFLIVGLAMRVAPKFEEMFAEMDIVGALPLPTMLLLNTCEALTSRPWLLTSGMFVLAWLHFSVMSRRKSRLRWWAVFLAILVPAALGFVLISLFLPLVGIMEAIGK